MQKIMEVDEHVGCAMSGLTGDARTLIQHGRVETQVRGETPTVQGYSVQCPYTQLRVYGV